MAEEHTHEVVVFENPHSKQKKKRGLTQKPASHQIQQSASGQNTSQQTGQDQQAKADNVSSNQAKEQGQTEGIKEAAKEEAKTQKVSENTFKEQGHQEGIKEAAKDAAKGKEETIGKLDSLVKSATEPLLQLQTSGYLMLNLVPDILTIDALKVTVRYRSILADEQIRSVFVKDIGDVFVESIPFAASLRIIDNTDKDNPILIKPFKKEDAEKAKSIIKGLITAQKENIDPATLEKSPETIKKIEALGKDVSEQ